VGLTPDQKQRISLGPGLVRDDLSAVLLDEPLTVIDLQVKPELRKTLKDINREFRLTMVLVTHDQTEAMTFADTVVVMNQGEVIQAGSPQELFDRPATDYVGYFIGSPQMNYLPAVRDGDRIIVPGTGLSRAVPAGVPPDGLSIAFRPEHVGMGAGLTGKVTRVCYEGADQVLAVSLGENKVRIRVVAIADATGSTVQFSVPQDRLRIYHIGRLVA
jgi:glycerol transport system ATP-binding protein